MTSKSDRRTILGLRRMIDLHTLTLANLDRKLAALRQLDAEARTEIDLDETLRQSILSDLEYSVATVQASLDETVEAYRQTVEDQIPPGSTKVRATDLLPHVQQPRLRERERRRLRSRFGAIEL